MAVVETMMLVREPWSALITNVSLLAEELQVVAEVDQMSHVMTPQAGLTVMVIHVAGRRSTRKHLMCAPIMGLECPTL